MNILVLHESKSRFNKQRFINCHNRFNLDFILYIFVALNLYKNTIFRGWRGDSEAERVHVSERTVVAYKKVLYLFNRSTNLYAWTQTICACRDIILIHRSKLTDYDDSLPKVHSSQMHPPNQYIISCTFACNAIGPMGLKKSSVPIYLIYNKSCLY